MLVNVDFDALQQAITPSVEKLAKHGVQSVRQRVANLSTLTPTSHHPTSHHPTPHHPTPHNSTLNHPIQFATILHDALCTSSRELTTKEIVEIDRIEQSYLEPAFIAGK
jgi:hypothetical protein